MANTNENRPAHNPLTSSDSELQQFIDPPGGVPLDSEEVQERRRLREEKLKEAGSQRLGPGEQPEK